MTSRQAEQHADAGGYCPKCADSHYKVDQIIVSIQDVSDAIWSSSEYCEDEAVVIKVECQKCGHVLYDQTDRMMAAIQLIVDENQEIKS